MVLFGITLYKTLLIFPSNQRVTRAFQHHLVAFVTLFVFRYIVLFKLKVIPLRPQNRK